MMAPGPRCVVPIPKNGDGGLLGRKGALVASAGFQATSARLSGDEAVLGLLWALDAIGNGTVVSICSSGDGGWLVIVVCVDVLKCRRCGGVLVCRHPALAATTAGDWALVGVMLFFPPPKGGGKQHPTKRTRSAWGKISINGSMKDDHIFS